MIEDPFLGQVRDFINSPGGANTKEAISGKFFIGPNRAQKMVDALNTEIASAAKPSVAPINNTSATEQTNNIKNSSPAPATSSSGGSGKPPASAPPIATLPEDSSGQNNNTGKPAATSPKAKVRPRSPLKDVFNKLNKDLEKEGLKQKKTRPSILANLAEYSTMHKLAKEQRSLGNTEASRGILQDLYEPVGLPNKYLSDAEKEAKTVLRDRQTQKSQTKYLNQLKTNESVKTRDREISARLSEERSAKKSAQELESKTDDMFGGRARREQELEKASQLAADRKIKQDHLAKENAERSRIDRIKEPLKLNRERRKETLGARNDSTNDRLAEKSISRQNRQSLNKRLFGKTFNVSAMASMPSKTDLTNVGVKIKSPYTITNTAEQNLRKSAAPTIRELEVAERRKPKPGGIKGSTHSGKGGYSPKQSTTNMSGTKAPVTAPMTIASTIKQGEAFEKNKREAALKERIKARLGDKTKGGRRLQPTQSGDRGLDAVKKLGAPTFRPITSLHTQMTPSTDIARGFDGTAYPRPGTRSNIPFVSKYDRNFGQGPVPIYEEAKNGGTGGRLVGKSPSTVTTDLTQSTHYNEEQAATDRRDQATARAKNPNFKRVDPDADARTAAYLGLNTTIGSEKPIDDHLRLGGRGNKTKETVFTDNNTSKDDRAAASLENQKNNPLQSTSSRQVVPPAPDGPVQPVRTGVTNPSLGEMSDDFDRTNSAIKPLPSELAGISNLGEADANAYGRAYNQSLVNNRIGRKAGFEDLKINDITMTDRVTGKQIAGAALSNHTVASVAGYGSRSLTTGYGMGWGNAWRASRSEHAIRAISVVNPLSRGNISGALETLGRTTTLDRLKFKANPGAANRFAAAAAPAFATGTLAFGMYDNQDMGELATNFLLPAVAIPSARVGIALGGMITPAKTAKNFGVIRGLGLAGGAVGGFVAGAAAVIGVSAGIRDVTSNTSSIRSMSKKIATSEVFVQDNNSRQSLTARQMSLNKLSRSGLNDRALLLSNEAAQLKGVL